MSRTSGYVNVSGVNKHTFDAKGSGGAATERLGAAEPMKDCVETPFVSEYSHSLTFKKAPRHTYKLFKGVTACVLGECQCFIFLFRVKLLPALGKVPRSNENPIILPCSS